MYLNNAKSNLKILSNLLDLLEKINKIKKKVLVEKKYCFKNSSNPIWMQKSLGINKLMLLEIWYYVE
jgi:hypothetical protein